jgi:hypothetical protein
MVSCEALRVCQCDRDGEEKRVREQGERDDERDGEELLIATSKAANRQGAATMPKKGAA